MRKKLGVVHPAEVVVFNASITDESAGRLCAAIYEASNYCLSCEDKPPVKLFICTSGGCLETGIQLYDTLPTMCPTGLWTIGTGSVQSAGTVLLQAGDKVFGTEDSRYLIHNVLLSGGASEEWKNRHEFKAHEEDCKFWDKILVNVYKKHLTVGLRSIKDLMDESANFDAKKALQIGLIQQIV